LSNRKVLVAAGYATMSSAPSASAELYDPDTGTFAATGSMSQARPSHTATLMPNEKVLIAGGTSLGGYLSSAELYVSQ
jgi:hypothetical protein